MFNVSLMNKSIIFSLKKYETAWQDVTPFSLTLSSWSAADTSEHHSLYQFVVFGWELWILYSFFSQKAVLYSFFIVTSASTLTHLLFFGVSHPTSAVNATPSMCFITYIFSLLYLNPPTFPPPTHSWTGSDETPVPSHVAIYLLSFNSFSCSKDQLMLVKTGLCRLFLLWCWYCISGQCWCFCWLKYPPSEIQWLLCMISYNNVCAVLEKNTNEAVDSNSCFPPYFFQLLP